MTDVSAVQQYHVSSWLFFCARDRSRRVQRCQQLQVQQAGRQQGGPIPQEGLPLAGLRCSDHSAKVAAASLQQTSSPPCTAHHEVAASRGSLQGLLEHLELPTGCQVQLSLHLRVPREARKAAG